jgi:hypothetical protein
MLTSDGATVALLNIESIGSCICGESNQDARYFSLILIRH